MDLKLKIILFSAIVVLIVLGIVVAIASSSSSSSGDGSSTSGDGSSTPSSPETAVPAPSDSTISFTKPSTTTTPATYALRFTANSKKGLEFLKITYKGKVLKVSPLSTKLKAYDVPIENDTTTVPLITDFEITPSSASISSLSQQGVYVKTFGIVTTNPDNTTTESMDYRPLVTYKGKKNKTTYLSTKSPLSVNVKYVITPK